MPLTIQSGSVIAGLAIVTGFGATLITQRRETTAIEQAGEAIAIARGLPAGDGPGQRTKK